MGGRDLTPAPRSAALLLVAQLGLPRGRCRRRASVLMRRECWTLEFVAHTSRLGELALLGARRCSWSWSCRQLAPTPRTSQGVVRERLTGHLVASVVRSKDSRARRRLHDLVVVIPNVNRKIIIVVVFIVRRLTGALARVGVGRGRHVASAITRRGPIRYASDAKRLDFIEPRPATANPSRRTRTGVVLEGRGLTRARRGPARRGIVARREVFGAASGVKIGHRCGHDGVVGFAGPCGLLLLLLLFVQRSLQRRRALVFLRDEAEDRHAGRRRSARSVP